VPPGHLGADWEACLKAATSSVSCWPSGTLAQEHSGASFGVPTCNERLRKEIHRCTAVVGIIPDRVVGSRLVGSLARQGAARSSEEWCSISLEAPGEVRALRFPDADHGTEHAPAASLAARGSGWISRRSPLASVDVIVNLGR